MLKENTSGMDGMNEIFISSPHFVIHAGLAGTDWAWMGRNEILFSVRPLLFIPGLFHIDGKDWTSRRFLAKVD